MRLVAKREVWVADAIWKGKRYLMVTDTHATLPPYSGAHVCHLQEGDTLNFTNLPTDGSDPYKMMAEEYGEFFTLEGG